jgi:hypothetical protein
MSSGRSVVIQRFIVSATTSLGDFRARAFLLQNGMRVGEEDVFAVEKLGGDFGGALGQDIQIDFDGDGFVQVFHVGAVPAEGFAALADFQAGGVDIAAVENIEKIFGGNLRRRRRRGGRG